MSSSANSEFNNQNDGTAPVDNSYASSRNEPIAVTKDEDLIESNDRRNPDSDEALEQDDREAISEENILEGDRTRHAKPTGTYQEPSDEQDLPKSVLDGTDGMSSV